MKKIISLEGQLFEGPVWNDKRESLFYTDIKAGTVFEYNPNNNTIKSWVVGEYSGCIFLNGSHDEIVVAVDDKIINLNLTSSKITPIINMKISDKVRFNDGKCDSNGNIIVGTMAINHDLYGIKNLGKLYQIFPNGQYNILEENLSIPNGMAWDISKKCYYHIETVKKCVFRYDYNVNDSSISNKSVVIDMSNEVGVPDGMTIDIDGNLWIAMWGGYKVVHVNPLNGDKICEISVPDENVTSCTFGGKDLTDLYITTEKGNIYVCTVTVAGRTPFPFPRG